MRLSDEMHHFMDRGHVCVFECDMFVNGRVCVCVRVCCWKCGVFFFSFLFFFLLFSRVSLQPRSGVSVPLPSPLFEPLAVGQVTKKKTTKKQQNNNNNHQTNRIVSQDGEPPTWPRLPPSVCVSCDCASHPSLSSILRPCHPPLSECLLPFACWPRLLTLPFPQTTPTFLTNPPTSSLSSTCCPHPPPHLQRSHCVSGAVAMPTAHFLVCLLNCGRL